MASSLVAVKPEDSVNSNFATLIMDSGASGHYFNDAIIRNLKPHLQNYVHLTTPRKILTAGGALSKGTAEGVLQGLVTDDNGDQILVRVDIVMVLGIGRKLFSVMTVAKKRIVTILDYENPRLEGFNVTVPLQSESGNLCSFVLDSSANQCDAKESEMIAVANAQMWHRKLGHVNAQSLDILHKRDGTGTNSRELSRAATSVPWGKLNSLLTPRQPTTRSAGICSCTTGTGWSPLR